METRCDAPLSLHTRSVARGYPLGGTGFFPAASSHGRVEISRRVRWHFSKGITVKTLFGTPSDRTVQASRSRSLLVASADEPPMQPFGIEQFELEPFQDSGIADMGPGSAGKDLHPAGSLSGGSTQVRRRTGRGRTGGKLLGSEAGMATAEYAIATLAAVGLAGLLVVILRSEEVRGFLLNLIRTALSLP